MSTIWDDLMAGYFNLAKTGANNNDIFDEFIKANTTDARNEESVKDIKETIIAEEIKKVEEPVIEKPEVIKETETTVKSVKVKKVDDVKVEEPIKVEEPKKPMKTETKEVPVKKEIKKPSLTNKPAPHKPGRPKKN